MTWAADAVACCVVRDARRVIAQAHGCCCVVPVHVAHPMPPLSPCARHRSPPCRGDGPYARRRSDHAGVRR